MKIEKDTNISEVSNIAPHISTTSQQSGGAIIAIVIILAMIVVGAFYAWNKRIAEQPTFGAQFATSTAL